MLIILLLKSLLRSRLNKKFRTIEMYMQLFHLPDKIDPACGICIPAFV